MGLRLRLRAVLLKHPHVKAIFGCEKKLNAVKIGLQNGGFWEFKGLNIKYSYRDPQKALPYPEHLLTYFA